jgi:cell division protein FtsB
VKQYFPYILLGIAVVLFSSTFLLSDGAEQLKTLHEQRERLEREHAGVQSRVDELKSTLVGMDENPRVLEKLAREELKLARENETIILFDTEEPKEPPESVGTYEEVR